MRAVAGRWIWGLSGAVTAIALGVPGVMLIAQPGMAPLANFANPQQTSTRTVTIPQRVTSVTVDSYGAPVSVRAGGVSRVHVTETIMWGGPSRPAPQPSVTQAVSGGNLTLAAPECAAGGAMTNPVSAVGRSAPSRPSRPSRPFRPSAPGNCQVAFDVTTPAGVRAAVASGGGTIVASGVAGADLDSGGGFVAASQIGGPLTVTSDGGFVQVDGLTGALNADSGGGPLVAQDLAAPSAVITTEDGSALVDYSAAPDSVTIRTSGGPARLGVPGGPYALTADSLGGPEKVTVPVAATARRLITISTDGAALDVVPADGASLPARGLGARTGRAGLTSAGPDVHRFCRSPGLPGREPRSTPSLWYRRATATIGA